MGTLLLDPYGITISAAADASQTGFVPTGNSSTINNGTLQNALAAASVTISTGGTGSPGTQVGTITVAAPVTWSAHTTLTLTAANSIAVNAAVTVAGGAG